MCKIILILASFFTSVSASNIYLVDDIPVESKQIRIESIFFVVSNSDEKLRKSIGNFSKSFEHEAKENVPISNNIFGVLIIKKNIPEFYEISLLKGLFVKRSIQLEENGSYILRPNRDPAIKGVKNVKLLAEIFSLYSIARPEELRKMKERIKKSTGKSIESLLGIHLIKKGTHNHN